MLRELRAQRGLTLQQAVDARSVARYTSTAPCSIYATALCADTTLTTDLHKNWNGEKENGEFNQSANI